MASCVLPFSLGAEFGARGQIGRATEVRDKLAEDQPFGIALKDARIVQRARGQARVVIRSARGGDIGGQGREETRASLPSDLLSGQRAKIRDADARVIAQRALLRFMQRKHGWLGRVQPHGERHGHDHDQEAQRFFGHGVIRQLVAGARGAFGAVAGRWR